MSQVDELLKYVKDDYKTVKDSFDKEIEHAKIILPIGLYIFVFLEFVVCAYNISVAEPHDNMGGLGFAMFIYSALLLFLAHQGVVYYMKIEEQKFITKIVTLLAGAAVTAYCSHRGALSSSTEGTYYTNIPIQNTVDIPWLLYLAYSSACTGDISFQWAFITVNSLDLFHLSKTLEPNDVVDGTTGFKSTFAMMIFASIYNDPVIFDYRWTFRFGFYQLLAEWGFQFCQILLRTTTFVAELFKAESISDIFIAIAVLTILSQIWKLYKGTLDESWVIAFNKQYKALTEMYEKDKENGKKYLDTRANLLAYPRKMHEMMFSCTINSTGKMQSHEFISFLNLLHVTAASLKAGGIEMTDDKFLEIQSTAAWATIYADYENSDLSMDPIGYLNQLIGVKYRTSIVDDIIVRSTMAADRLSMVAVYALTAPQTDAQEQSTVVSFVNNPLKAAEAQELLTENSLRAGEGQDLMTDNPLRAAEAQDQLKEVEVQP